LAGYAVTGMVTGVILQMDRREVIAAGEATPRNTFHGPGTMVMSVFLLVAVVAIGTLLGKKVLVLHIRDRYCCSVGCIWYLDESPNWPDGGE
jgi:hypothetical protein